MDESKKDPVIKTGDVVSLKSGGLHMTVGYINDDKADVVWFDGEGVLREEKLHVNCLQRIS